MASLVHAKIQKDRVLVMLPAMSPPNLALMDMAFTRLTVPMPASDTSEAAPLSLIGPIWDLVQLKDHLLLPRTTIIAQFRADGMVSGSDGCNQYRAPFTIEGSKISIGLGMSTLMACPPAVMDQAQAYLAALQTTDRFRIDGEKLSLEDSAGVAIAIFTVEKQDLMGITWQVISYNNGREAVVSVITGSEMSATFNPDGRVSGYGGCNDYVASYVMADNTITIGPPSVTRKMCAQPEGIMEQEQAYLAALQSATTFQIKANRLQMHTAENALALIMRRASPQSPG